MDNDEQVWQRVVALHEADAAALELGVQLRSASAGAAVVSVEVTKNHLGSLGQLHGGVLFTLADVAMSYAGNSRGGQSMAIRASIDYVEGAELGEVLVATANEHSMRGKAGIYDVVIRCEADDRLVATFRGNTLRLGAVPTTVVHNQRDEFDVYIGREVPELQIVGSKWGNPFVMADESDAERDRAIEQYRAWIVDQPDLMASIEELRGKRLGCWCAPQACHGDVLVEILGS